MDGGRCTARGVNNQNTKVHWAKIKNFGKGVTCPQPACLIWDGKYLTERFKQIQFLFTVLSGVTRCINISLLSCLASVLACGPDLTRPQFHCALSFLCKPLQVSLYNSCFANSRLHAYSGSRMGKIDVCMYTARSQI